MKFSIEPSITVSEWIYTLNNYRFFKNNPLVQSPCNPRRTLGLYGNCTKGFLLNNLYCLECNILLHVALEPEAMFKGPPQCNDTI